MSHLSDSVEQLRTRVLRQAETDASALLNLQADSRHKFSQGDPMPMFRLMYFSAYRIDRVDGPMTFQLNNILSTANRHNQANGITGALIFDSEWFVQILEGQRAAVWSMFKSIERDKRHAKVTPVEMNDAMERHFGRWWMGCCERNARTAPAFAPYLRDGRFQPDEMPAHDILALMIDLETASLARELVA